MNTESFIKKIMESEEFQKFTEEEEVNEMSVTGNVAGYQTPNAFSTSEKDFEKMSKERSEKVGFKVVGKSQHKNFKPVYATENLSDYKQAMTLLQEASYKEYKRDDSRSTNRKINDSITNINRTIYEVERVVEHALKLKTEMSVDQRTLWGSSLSRLRKISERINRITKKIHELGA